MARNSAVDFKHKVGIFSLEMSNQQLTERIITSKDPEGGKEFGEALLRMLRQE